MKYTDTDSLVVLDDQSKSKKFKSFRNIETVLPVIDNYVPLRGNICINHAKKEIPLLPNNPSWEIEWDYDVDEGNPPKDNEEIFYDFFGEIFLAPNELILNNYILSSQKKFWDYFVFAKKNYLDKKKNYLFNSIKNLYFYKIGHDYLKPKLEKFSLPSSINTEHVELMFIGDGQIVDFKSIKPKKFPNLKKLILQTKIKSNKIPSFPKLKELYYDTEIYKQSFSTENLNNLKHLIVPKEELKDDELKKLYKIHGKKFKIYNADIKNILKSRKILV